MKEIMVVLVLVVYILPSVIGFVFRAKHQRGIFALNLWTG
jgi:hypothetical protein